MKPAISVVIPTYQRREVVVGAIESVLAQEYRATDIVVVDDGSTDGTADALEKRFGRAIRVVRQPNLGVSAARNAGVAATTGEAVAFLDSDDRWRAHHLGVIAELLEMYPGAVLVSTRHEHRRGDEPPSASVNVDMARRLLFSEGHAGPMPAAAVRRHAFDAIGGFDEALPCAEDTDLFTRLSVRGPIAMVAASTLDIRASADSLSLSSRANGDLVAVLDRLARNALTAIDESGRPDIAQLRLGPQARIEMAAALGLFASGGTVADIRRHLAAAKALGHRLNDAPWTLTMALCRLPGWERPSVRARALARMVLAAPSRRPRFTARLLLSAVRELRRDRLG